MSSRRPSGPRNPAGAPWTRAREEEARAKRDLILSAAAKHIAQYGYARTSMAAIAAELGLSTNAPYYYFESKEEILFRFFERSQGLIDECIGRAESAPGDGNRKVQRFVAELVELIATEPLPPSSDAILLSEERLQAVMKRAAAHVTRLARLVQQGIEDGSVRDCDAELTVHALLGALYSMSYPSLWDELSRDRVLNVLLGLVERGLAPRQRSSATHASRRR